MALYLKEPTMLKNYFLVALRNFWRNKVFSTINILGLSIGISASLVIFLIVSYDFGFDHFQPNGDRIYRITSNFVFQGNPLGTPGVCSPLAEAIKKEATGIELVAPLYTADNISKVTAPYPDANHPAIFRKQLDIIYADTAYCSLMGYAWLAGSPRTALSEPYQTVLTESSARKYFPGLNNDQILGQHLIFADSITTTITGIIKDIDQRTDFNFQTLISWSTLTTPRLQPQYYTGWGGANSASQLFVRVKPGTTREALTAKLKAVYLAHNKPDPKDKNTTAFLPQPLSDLHFNTTYGAFDNGGGNVHKPTLYGLLAVAAFLLVLACINFINLTTAQAAQRAKEIGIRKTMGGQRTQLAFQFLNETFLLTVIATALSIALAPLLLKVFSDFVPKDLHFSLTRQPEIIPFLLALIIGVSLLSGIYPALVLSSYKPVLVLKNQAFSGTAKTRAAWLRKSLTVSQFVIAQVFIIATILVGRQISFALNKDLGFKKEAIVYFNTPYNRPATQGNVLLQKLKAIPGIDLISRSNQPPSSGATNTTIAKYSNGKKDIKTELQLLQGDTNYIRLYHLNLLAGSNITQCDTTNALVINETYAHTLGFPDARKAVGSQIIWWNGSSKPVVGVVADFHQKSLRKPIKPLAIVNGAEFAYDFDIALHPQNADGTAWKTTIAKIETAYKALYPEDDFSSQFFDESIAQFYTKEKNASSLLVWATGLAIFISCLGLLGLVIYITNQRTKEIGIRKVIGASVTNLVFLLSRDLIKLVGLAILIATPIAWWGSNKWLENFAYRTTLSWWIFAASGAMLLLIAFTVLGLRTIKAATANPVNSLRSE
jgi:putative ABC transport system permease protein